MDEETNRRSSSCVPFRQIPLISAISFSPQSVSVFCFVIFLSRVDAALFLAQFAKIPALLFPSSFMHYQSVMFGFWSTKTPLIPSRFLKLQSRGVVVRALASHQCGPDSLLRLGVICELSFLVLFSALRGFPPGFPVFPLLKNLHLIKFDFY